MFAQTWAQFEKDGMIEFPEAGNEDGFVVNINPLQAVPKNDTELRPVMDCSRGGVNE